MDRLEQTEEAQDPALTKAGFSSSWEYTKHVVKNVAVTALKGAVIGAVGLTVLALPVAGAAGAVSGLLGLVGIKSAMGTATLLAAATQGLLLGGAAGGAIGLAKGVGGAEEAVEDAAADVIAKANRSRTMAANEQMMAMNMERLRGASQQGMVAGISPQPGLPNQSQGIGRSA
jgi:hypothetical protein